MQRENILIAQISQAVEFAKDDILEYRRIGLILFDNATELILKNQINEHLPTYLRRKRQLKWARIEKELERCKNFEILIDNSVKLDLISKTMGSILKFSHKVRNSTYHSLSLNQLYIEASLTLNGYIIMDKLIDLIRENEFINYSDEAMEQNRRIIRRANISTVLDLKEVIGRFLDNFPATPQESLHKILYSKIDYIYDGIYVMEYFDSWEEFKTSVLDVLFPIFRNGKFVWESFPENFRVTDKHTMSINKFSVFMNLIPSEEFLEIRKKIEEIKELDYSKAFDFFSHINQLINPLYIGLFVYISGQEDYYED